MENTFGERSEAYTYVLETVWLPLKRVYEATRKTVSITTTAILLFVFLFFILASYAFYNNSPVAAIVRNESSLPKTQQSKKSQTHCYLNCTNMNQTLTCEQSLPHKDQEPRSSSASCPDYFGWIHEDLRPWKETGISMEMLERARRTANFRLVILNGTMYVETYDKAFQTRDVFTLWGILQLLKMYPRALPDLDLMFDCDDIPVIRTRDYKETGTNATPPPPPSLFRYCGSDETLDIPFPDWSFWGWPEVNIIPWNLFLKELEEGNKKVKWNNREPYAYWKGNPYVAETRQDLLKCNISKEKDWNARLYKQDWSIEDKIGFKHSNIAEQCTHRYKIYIEGRAWSVSKKYILACDSPTLMIQSRYYDTFTRSLEPLHHYWPIKNNDKCRSIKFAVEWGNKHKKKAQKIGKAGSNFVGKNMTMEYVYDYMFHLLNEYAKMLRFKPSKPEKAVEFRSETMACRADGLTRQFMMDSIVKYSSNSMPCNMPPLTDPHTQLLLDKAKKSSLEQVEMLQNKYYQTKQV